MSPTGAAPAWAGPEAGKLVVAPESVKDLEYQTMCVPRPGASPRAGRRRRPDRTPPEFEANGAARLTLDRLNVACSRATEKLLFLNGPESRTELSRDVLGPEHSEHDAGDVVRAASPTDLTADERADLYMDEADALLETNCEIRRRALAVVAYRTLDATGEARRIDDDTVHRLVTPDRDP